MKQNWLLQDGFTVVNVSSKLRYLCKITDQKEKYQCMQKRPFDKIQFNL